MQIAVTGSQGFLGSNLKRILEGQGHTLVPLHHTQKLSEIEQALKLAKPEVVLHLGALFIGEHQSAQVLDLIKGNVAYTAVLLEAMRNASVRNIITAGTAWQYFAENDPSPANLYAATKRAGLEILKFYLSAHQMRAINLLIYDTYGEGDTRAKLIPTLMKRIRSRETMALSPGEQEISLVHVGDIAKGFCLAMDRVQKMAPGAYAEYALRSENVLTVRQVIETFREASGFSEVAKLGASPYRAREVMKIWRGTPVLPGWQASQDFQSWVRSQFETPN